MGFQQPNWFGSTDKPRQEFGIQYNKVLIRIIPHHKQDIIALLNTVRAVQLAHRIRLSRNYMLMR